MSNLYKRVATYVYALSFLALLLIPLIMTNNGKNVKSDLDNRRLVEFPEVGEDGFSNGFEQYLRDRIGFRDQLVTGYQIINDKFAGELVHPSYTYGKDGYMFFKMHNNISYGSYHQVFAQAVLKMQQYCESRGTKFYFLLDPEKISVYRRYLPVGVNYDDEWIDELLDYMREIGINCISNKDLLTDLSYTEQVFNRQYDAGHWNDLGSFYGTNNLWNEIHKDFPIVTEYSKDEFRISTGTGKYLASSRFPVYEEIPVFTLKSKWKDITDNYKGLNLHKSYRDFRYYVNGDENAVIYPKMLIFHGSYYNRGPKFFVGRSREYIGIHDYQNVLNLDYYYNIFQPEIVIFEVAEYTFSDRYFDSNKMVELAYNPSLIKQGKNIEDSIELAKENAEEFTVESSVKICTIPGDGFDNVYYERDLPMARYVYLLTDNNVFDLQKDIHGMYSAGIPHEAIGNEATIYYEDYNGRYYYTIARVQNAQQFVKIGENISYTDGAKYDDENESFVIETKVKNNRFNSVQLQLLDGYTGEYLSTILSVLGDGSQINTYVHTKDTGWYRIRLKANSNIKDEGVDIYAFLVKGERYSYAFDLSYSEKKAVINNYSFFGPSSLLINGREMVKTLERSEGAISSGYKRYIMKTDIEDNAFNSVVLQIRDNEKNEWMNPLSNSNQAGDYSGWYIHAASSGEYLVSLRGNSNLKDECVIKNIELQENMLYKWSYTVEHLEQKEIVVRDFSFQTVGEFIE